MNEDQDRLLEAEILIRRNSVQRLFDGYYYDFKRSIGVPRDFKITNKKSALEQAKEKAMS